MACSSTRERCRCFGEILQGDDDLISLVLRGHLVAEEVLYAAVAAHCPTPEHLSSARLRYPQLVSLLRSREKIPAMPDHLWRALSELNRLRNALAHQLEPRELTERVESFARLVLSGSSATEVRTFVDTDVLIDIARRDRRAIDFWRRAEARSTVMCSVISLFELFAGCRNLREQRATLRDLLTVNIVQVESGDSVQALEWYRSYHLSRGIGFLDCFVAAAARSLDCEVHTLNTKHFRSIPGLRTKCPY